MEVGIGLPATIPGVTGEQLVDWARRAEARGFSSLGTIDRLVYGNYEPLIALAARTAARPTSPSSARPATATGGSWEAGLRIGSRRA